MVAHMSDSPDQAINEVQALLQTDWLLWALRAAVEVGVPAGVPLEDSIGIDALAAATQTRPAELYRLMRALSANGFFESLPGRQFRHNRKSKLLRDDDPASMVPMMRMRELGKHDAAFHAIPASLRDGVNGFHHAHGEHMYQFLSKHPDASEAFNRTMVTALSQEIPQIASAYRDFSQAKRVLDVGGGMGHLLMGILQAYPHLEGAVFDLPTQRAAAEGFFKQHPAQARAQFVGGSFLESLPAGYDIYMIKNALWNWGDADNVRILSNMRVGMAGGAGRVLVMERLITRQNAPWSTVFDLGMMTLTQGGRSRTLEEYVDLAQQAQLQFKRSFMLPSTSLLEFAP